MEDREKNSKKTEKKFLLFKEKVYLPIIPAICTPHFAVYFVRIQLP